MTFRCVKFTGTEEQYVFRRTKQNLSQIIPRISFTFHFKFSTVHWVWMQCECTGTRGFHAEVKENASKHYANNSTYMSMYFRHSPAPCFPITKIGRSLTLAVLETAVSTLRQIENVSFDSPLTAVVAVNGLIRGTLVQLTVPPLRWGLLVLLGHFQVHAIVRVGRAADSGHASLQTRQW